ncbi:MAG: site-specific DNA-methyltransferase [Pseudomonadota bacterium]|nr:site-specific DNA-methyltransferase [Pseudomonadota bacterium]
MKKLKMHSPNLTQENIARIRELFPGCVTEAKGDDGKVRLAVDLDQLRQELSESIVEGPQERYHLNWPGKREALLTANAPIAKTLRPCREESVDFDTTKNLFIEGDNLDALKLLQETYLGKVKMIYIDPPYNTGNDFIYEDDFAENTEEFLKRSNQKDEQGNRLVANTESNGRFHSDWLSMMYPRLKTDNIKPDRTSEDLLFQVLLDWGVDLTLPISKKNVRVKKDEGGRLKDEKKESVPSIHPSSFQEFEVFFVDENALIACFDTGINEELVKELTKFKPLRVVFRDTGFASDAAKINVEQIFRQMAPHTEVRSI